MSAVLIARTGRKNGQKRCSFNAGMRSGISVFAGETNGRRLKENVMREKKDSLLITFPSTTSAMAAECLFQERHLPGRLIPVPGEIRAGCGLAWKTDPGGRALLLKALEISHIPYDNDYRLMI